MKKNKKLAQKMGKKKGSNVVIHTDLISLSLLIFSFACAIVFGMEISEKLFPHPTTLKDIVLLGTLALFFLLTGMYRLNQLRRKYE